MIDREATCKEEGLRHRECLTYSGHREEEAIPLSEHQYEKKVIKEASCTESGTAEFVCSVCGDSYTEQIPPIGHRWGEWITDKEPTVHEEGHQCRVCQNDNTHTEEASIEMLEITVTVVDAAFAVTGFSLLWLFAVIILWDVRVLIWYKKLKKKQLEQMKEQK